MDYKNENIPASFDGFRIVHISDLHAGTFAQHPEKLDKFVNIINSQNPDLICFTGDFVSINLTEAEGLVDNLKRMNSKCGVCSVLGNHDFFIYSREYPTQDDKNNAVDSLAMLQRKKLGWHLLRNESFVIEKGDEHITIVGVDNSNCDNQGFHTIHRGDLDKALKGTEGFKVLLSHDPSHWRGEVLEKTDIPLTLSGHTHAAQIRIFGWTPATWMFKETYGRYERQTSRGLQTLYVNIGLGGTLPLRIGANPEITVIDLHRD